MTICTPDYYNAFHCIAGDCPATCCAAGWEIDLDEDSMERYQSTEGEFGEKLCRFIRKDEDFFFFPMEHGACPFLTGKKLCSIYENLGEDAMPVTCQEFPRYFSDCGAYEQRDLSLACPEVARIFYEGPLSFGIRTFEVEDEDGEMFSEDDDYDSEQLLLRWQLIRQRDQLIRDLERRQGDVFARLDAMGLLLPDDETILSSTIAAMEPVNADWTKLSPKLLSLLESGKKEEAVQAFFREPSVNRWMVKSASYLLFRYWLDAFQDNVDTIHETGNADTEPQMRLIARSLEILSLMGAVRLREKGSFALQDMIDTAVLFSRQIEFDDEIIAALSTSPLLSDTIPDDENDDSLF
jgi:Fe-S-cluster containining protein